MEVDRMHLKRTLKKEWSEIRKDATEEWDKITDQDLENVDGEFDNLVSVIEEKYEIPHSEAADEVHEFLVGYYIMEE